MKNKKKTIMLVAILMLAIGFASISTTLLITGVIKIGANVDDYNVIFTKAKIGEVDQTITQTNKTADTIIFETPVLKSIDDEAVLDYDVKNTSTQYDAKVKMKCYAVNDTDSLLNTYVSVTGVFDDKNVTFGSNATSATLSDEVVIPAQGTKSGTITMKLIKSYAGTETSNETTLNVKCEMTAVAGEKSSSSQPTTTPVIAKVWDLELDNNTNSEADFGDKICVGETKKECFYVLSNDGTNIKALAEWNLNVGDDKDTTVTEGIQQPTADGVNHGSVFMAYDIYWGDNEDAIDLTNTNNLVYPYLTAYKTTLEGMSVTFAGTDAVTLIKKSELESASIGCASNSCASAPSWITNIAYWTRSTGDDRESWYVGNDGTYASISLSVFGVRPVINIPVSSLK